MTIFRCTSYIAFRPGAISSVISQNPSLARQNLLFRSPAKTLLNRHVNRFYSLDQTLVPPSVPPSPKKPSILRRILGFSAIAVFSFVVGTVANPNILKMHSTISELSNGETNGTYETKDDFAQEVDDFINAHPLVESLRGNEQFKESRPHLQIPSELRGHTLTGGTLSGPDKIVVPPYVWSEEGGKSMVSMLYLGPAVSGHPGIVHGGLLATLLDEGLARCCFPALPNGIGVTANLNIDYRRPAPASSYFVLRAKTTKVEGRKAWVEGSIESVPEEGKDTVVFVEAKALFVEPKNAASLPRLYRTT